MGFDVQGKWGFCSIAKKNPELLFLREKDFLCVRIQTIDADNAKRGSFKAPPFVIPASAGLSSQG